MSSQVLLVIATTLGVAFAGAAQAGTPPVNPRISELFYNPSGTDAPNEYVELRNDIANAGFGAGTYLVGIEGDSTSTPGDVNFVFNLTGLSFGSAGYMVINQAGNTYTVDSGGSEVTGVGAGFGGAAGFLADAAITDMENASTSFLLIQAAVAPTITDDIDSNDDGTPDGAVFSGWTLLDSVGITDSATDISYAAITFLQGGGIASGTTVNTTVNGYLARTRIGPSQSTGSAAADWVCDSPTGAAPNYTVSNAVAGSSAPGSYIGLQLNHIGAANWPSLPVELQQFSID